MAINLIGPQAYDFQYLLTTYVGVLHLDDLKTESSLHVEKFGSEDATLYYKIKSRKLVFDIQVKSGRSAFTLENFANCLNHFGAKQSNNILSKLMDNQERHFLLVTEGRCNDETELFLSNTMTPKTRSYEKATIAGLLDSLMAFQLFELNRRYQRIAGYS